MRVLALETKTSRQFSGTCAQRSNPHKKRQVHVYPRGIDNGLCNKKNEKSGRKRISVGASQRLLSIVSKEAQRYVGFRDLGRLVPRAWYLGRAGLSYAVAASLPPKPIGSPSKVLQARGRRPSAKAVDFIIALLARSLAGGGQGSFVSKPFFSVHCRKQTIADPSQAPRAAAALREVSRALWSFVVTRATIR